MRAPAFLSWHRNVHRVRIGIPPITLRFPATPPSLVAVFLCAVAFLGSTLRAQTLDTVILGDTASENAHGLAVGWDSPAPAVVVDANNAVYPSDPSLSPASDVVLGGLGHTARRLLPRTPNPDIYGGNANLVMAVDPVRQNYLTIKLWGSDTSSGIWFVLNVDGKELGLRHGGDSAAPDMLFGNKQIVTFAPNQWVYRTLALPRHLTQGKTSVSLKIRSMGWISDYDAGPLFGDYNKLMNSPSLGLYRIYTHLGSRLDVSGEAQGAGFTPTSPRALESEATVIANTKSAVNSQLAKLMGYSASSLKPWDLAWLARCYDARENLGETWISYGGSNTAATLVQRVVDSIDYHVARQATDANYQASFGNDSWGGGFGGLGNAIRLLWPQINAGSTMATTVAYGGSYGTLTRTAGWSRALRTSVDHGRYNRRGGLYANQDIYAVENTYLANRGLLLVDPANALLESEAQRYIQESAGMLPWAGADRSGGGAVPVKGTYPLGASFYEVTTDGTTKDGGGFVGSDYGEMGSYIVRLGVIADNSDVINRGLQIMRSRAVFRFPSFDDQGYRVMQAANPIGVRNRTLPGHYGYLERGNGGVDIAALGTATIGADLMGYFQNGITEGQQLRMINGSTDPYTVRDWTLAKAAAATGVPVPMAVGAPDFAWGDEENMVVAAKSGENRIFVNFYWAAPGSLNGWAKIFHLPAGAAPEISEVQVDDLRYRPSGTFETLGRRVESGTRQPFDNPESAYNGVTLPVALRSDLATAPSTNPDGGKGTGYTLRYGRWLIAINAHHADTYAVPLPSNFASALPLTELVSGATVSSASLTLAPKTTAVFYLPTQTDPAPRPARPLTLTAKATASAISLDWPDTAGGVSYRVKRATVSGGPYTTLATVGASRHLDATAVAGTTYHYVVSALNASSLEGGDSVEASAALKAAGLLNRTGEGAASASLASSSFPAANAFDGSASTKWNSGSTGVAASLAYDFGAGLAWAVTRYDITSADTTGRDPAAWTFQGSNDGSAWTTLDTRSGETFASRGLVKSYTFANPAGYRHYRLAVSAASGGLGFEIQLAELALFASDSGAVAAPATPTGFSATAGDNQIFLAWNPVADATRYVVRRATSADGAYAAIGETETGYCLDTSAPAAGVYFYTVAAANAGGESAPTVAVSATFGPSVPPAPTGLVATGGPNTGNVTLRWNAAPGALTYVVKRAFVSSGPYTTLATGVADTGYTDTGRANGVACYYVVSAVRSASAGPDSAEASVVPQTFVWSGTTSAWATASNWGGTAPSNGSLLIFSGTPTTTSTSNNLSGLSINGLVFNSGASAFTLAGNALTLAGDIRDYAANTQTVSLGLTLSADRVVEVQGGRLNLTGVVTDGANTFSLTKTGAGLLVLSGANTFDGGLFINSGTVGVGSASGTSSNLGTGRVTVSGESILRLGFGVTSNANTTTYANALSLAGGAIYVDDAFQRLTGTITVADVSKLGSTYNSGSSSAGERDKGLFLDGIVSGSADLLVRHSGFVSGSSSNTSIVHFNNGANTYSGTISVIPMIGTGGGSYLGVGAADALRYATVAIDENNTGSALKFGSSPVVFKTGLGAVTFGALTGAADLILTGYDLVNHTYGTDAITLAVGGKDIDTGFSGAVSGLGGITKTGAGVFTLSGLNTYAGATTVSGGTLQLASPLIGAGAVIVNSDAVLSADVSLGGSLTVNSGGLVAPGGDELGTLAPNGLSLASGAILEFGLGPVAASDSIALSGGAYVAPASGQAILLLDPATGFGPGTYPLITGATGIGASAFAIGTAAPAGYTYALSAADGTLSLIVTGPPPGVTGLLASARTTAVLLSWDAAPGATGYVIERSNSPDSGFASVGTSATTTYTATGLTDGVTYYFRVSGTNSLGTGVASAIIAATPQLNTWIAAPTSLAWSIAANWGGAAPMDNARLTFGSSSATNLTNDLTGLSLGGLLFNSGASAFTLSGQPVLLGGDLVNNATATQTINLQLTLLGDRVVTTNTGSVVLAGAIDDAGLGYGLVKTGTGSLTLSGPNSFTGGIAVQGGTLRLAGSSPLGAGDPITLANGTTLQLSAATVANDIVVPAGATVSLNKIFDSSSLAGRLIGGGTINESGSVSSGLVTLRLDGDNSGFTGTFNSANSGGSHRLRFNTPSAGSASAAWTLNCTTTDAYGFSFGSDSTIAFGSLAGTGYLRNNGNGAATLRIGDLGTNTTFSGTTMFNFALLKVGAGTLTLAGTNFYHSNVTTISAGILNVTGTLQTSALTVLSGATISGTGTLGGSATVNNDGLLAPGDGGVGPIGTLTLNGAFVPRAGSRLAFDLGTSSDLLALGTTSAYTAPSGGTVSIELSAATGFAPGTYTLITNVGTGTLSASHFTLASLPDGYAGSLSMNGTSLQVFIRLASGSWTGATSGAWSLAANWSEGTPLDGDRLFFGTATNSTLNNDLSNLLVSAITFNSGASAFTLGGNALRLGGDIVNNSTTAQTLSLPLVLTKNITLHTNTGGLTLSGVISESGGSFGINKTGTGILRLSGANTFSGGVTLSAGDTYVAGLGSGSPGAPTSGALGTGLVTLGGGRILFSTATTSLYNNLVAPAGTSTTLLEAGNFALTLHGAISGSGNITLDANTNYNGVRLAGDNSGFTGLFTLASTGSAARHKFDNAAAGSAAARWIINGPTDSGSFAFGTGTIHFGELSGSATQIRNNTGGSTIATVSIGALGTDSTFAGVFSGVGTIALKKVGTGVLTLSGANTYTGPTDIDGGTLRFTGAKSGTGAVNVNAGGTLAGTASVSGLVTLQNGGVIAPGAGGVGTLTLGSLALESGGTLALELGSTASSDKINLTGTYAGPASDRVIINLSAVSGFGPGSYSLLTGATGVSDDHFQLGVVPAGAYSYALSATSGTLTLQVTPLTALERWRLDHFATHLADGLAKDTADPDVDGRPNLLEYALGTDPLTNDAAPAAAVSIEQNRLVIRFTRDAAALVAIQVEASTNLVDWSTITTLPAGSAAWTGAATVIETGSDQARAVAVTDIIEISVAPLRFLRLRVGP